jgi:hypothetical protein
MASALQALVPLCKRLSIRGNLLHSAEAWGRVSTLVSRLSVHFVSRAQELLYKFRFFLTPYQSSTGLLVSTYSISLKDFFSQCLVNIKGQTVKKGYVGIVKFGQVTVLDLGKSFSGRYQSGDRSVDRKGWGIRSHCHSSVYTEKRRHRLFSWLDSPLLPLCQPLPICYNC